MTSVARLLCLALLAGCTGCTIASSAFSTRFPDNRAEDVATLVAALQDAPARTPRPVAVGVTAAPTQLYGFDLTDRRLLWKRAARLDGSPVLAGAMVLNQEGDRIIGRDLSSGSRRFAVSADGMRLVGADGEGQSIVFVLSKGVFSAANAQVVRIRAGSVLWRTAMPHQAGVPAVIGKVVLIPWGHQYLSGLDAETGEEIARLRVLDGVISQAFVEHGHAYAGGMEGVAQVTADLATGTLQGDRFIPAPRQMLPGRPAFLRDIYSENGVLSADSAGHSIGLIWAPAADRPRHVVVDDTLYLVFYRFVAALHHPSLTLRWLHIHDCDVVGAQATAGGLIFADRKGTFGHLDARSGMVRISSRTALPSTAVVLPRGAPWPGEPSEDQASPDLRRQLRAAAEDPDARLVPVRRYAVERLAELPNPEVTLDLLSLCGDVRLAASVRDAACDALSHRSAGKNALVAALDQHYDHLADVGVAPVGALARAMQTLGESEAYAALVSHLEDPHTPSEALSDLVRAIAALNPEQAAGPLSDFAHRYHADPIDEHVTEAVEAAILALYAIRGPIAIETLIDLAEDELGVRSIQKKAASLLAQLEDAARVEKARKKAALSAKVRADRPPLEPQPPLPERLTLALVRDTLRPARHELRKCMAQSQGNVFHGRMVLVVEEGEVLMVSVIPPQLQPCVEAVVRSQSFPRTRRRGRQQISYPLERR